MTLALLLTAVTGAWAQEEVLLTTINASSDFTSGSKTFDGVATVTITGNIACDEMSNMCWSAVYGSSGGSVTVEPADGTTISSCKFYFDNNGTYTISTAPFVLYPTMFNGSSFQIYTGPNCTGEQLYGSEGIKKIEVYAAAEAPITVDPGSSANTWTFSMPGSDVVLTPQYAPAAKWDVVENVEQLPTAIEGVIADTDAPLIVEGTVAFAGTSTEVKQGTVMYAVTPATETEAPALDAANKWSADVPTAKLVADGGIDVLVWYYIKGADTPQDQTATAENTFNDSEPACLTVTVLTNKFNIQFNAANANTIEAGKATVTVGGTAATVTDGKLEGVKMGREVKVKAKEGYKFRKVEVKKKEAAATPTLAEATAEDYGKVVCAAGHLHDAKTAVPDGCTAVGILSKVTETGHGLILALHDATYQEWVTVNGWASETSYAGTTLKVLPDDAARGTNLTSYTKLGETTVSNWAVAQKDDYVAIFVNLGSEVGDTDGITCSESMDVYITPAGGTSIYAASGLEYISATSKNDEKCWGFNYSYWKGVAKSGSYNAKNVRPVLGF